MKIVRYILGGRVGVDAQYNIGPSCYLLVVTVLGKTWRFLIDCGLEPTHDARGWLGVDLLLLEAILQGEKIDAVFVTHAHLDHVGYLPALEKFFSEKCRVICTTTTAALMPYIFADAVNQGVRRAGVLGRLPYTMWPIYKTLDRVEVIRKPEVRNLVPGIDFLVWPAGHIHGACSFIFRIKEQGLTRKIAFLGDASCHDQVLIPPAPLPPEEWLLDGDCDVIASMDCTNGGEDLPPWSKVLDEMADDSDRVVEQGGKWIGFTFSIVRWQMLIHELSKRIDRKGNKPALFGDGPSAIHVARLLRENPWWDVRPFDLSGAQMVNNRNGLKRDDVMGMLSGARVVTTSGMGHGPATSYFANLLGDPNSFFAASGYLAHGSNGRIVMEAKKGDEISVEGAGYDENGEPKKIRVLAERKQYRLTGHQHRMDGVEFALQLFGADSGAIARWKKAGRGKNLKNYLSDCDLDRLDRKHLGLTHANTKAYDWFQSYCGGWISTSRADREADRALEF